MIDMKRSCNEKYRNKLNNVTKYVFRVNSHKKY